MKNRKTIQALKGLLEVLDQTGEVAPKKKEHARAEAYDAIRALQEQEEYWVPVGEVGVDSGKVMVCDPCYVDSLWKLDTSPRAPMYAHKESGKVYYCVCHGDSPQEGAVEFDNFQTIIPDYGKCMNDLVGSGVFARVESQPSGEFSYRGCCEMARTAERAGQLDFRPDHTGVGVVAASGLGDGFYQVFARYADHEDWGRRVAELRVVFLDEPDDADDTDDEAEELEDFAEQCAHILARKTGTEIDDWCITAVIAEAAGMDTACFIHHRSATRVSVRASVSGSGPAEVMFRAGEAVKFLRRYDKRKGEDKG